MITAHGEDLAREAIELLAQATSNSLHPEVRSAWAERRDELIEELKQELS